MIKNNFKIVDDYVVIYIKYKKEIIETVIDLDDLEKLDILGYKFHAVWKEKINNYYAEVTEYLGIINGKPKYKKVQLHRFVKNAIGKKVKVDHINHDSLDNRKKNLRICTDLENNKHRKGANKNNKSGYRNVFWDKRNNKWVVHLQIDGKSKKLGSFDNVDEAGNFAEKKRKEIYKEYCGK